ncbi:hypothetical protein ABZ553_06440 [Streptomyces sparsogenes]|uniref:hypothetical protein n=1 Tax=Streptomyces sparsogenes TaxID=67365 RepID=UPI003408F91E
MMRQVFMRWAVAAVTCAALLGSVTGCAGQEKHLPPVSSSAVIGHWKGDCGATLDVARNGHFRFAEFPSGRGPHDERRLSGRGQWYLYRGGKAAPSPSLDLKYDRTLFSLLFTRSSDGALTRMRYEEEDRTCWFMRKG